MGHGTHGYDNGFDPERMVAVIESELAKMAP